MEPYWVEGVNIPHVGYGRMTVELTDELRKVADVREDARSVVFGMVPHMVKGWWEGQRPAVITMWETDKLPDHFRRMCPMFETVFVPCDWNKELFDSVHDNVVVMPLGIDHQLWQPQPASKKKMFRFMTGGSGWLRKGVDQVIRAFKDAALPDAELVIKCPPDIYDDPFHGATEQNFGPNITFIRKALRREEERDLHASADCFVSGSRGEGFGLIPLQHLALGNLVIGPAHTGHLMFSDLFDYALSSRPEPAQMVNHKECGNWLVPDHAEMVDAMRDAYSRGKPPMRERRERHAQTAGFSWANAVHIMLGSHPPSGLVEHKMWEPAGGNKVRVLALRKVEADIGTYKIRISKGDSAEIPVSALDVLLAAGVVAEL